jgi:ketosteroid isomerase-like protein
MATTDIEIVRRAFEDWGRGDFAAVLAVCDPDIELHDPGRTGASFQGHEGLMRFWREWLENWDDYRIEPVEFVEVGGKIFVAASQVGRGRSGIEVGQELFQVFRLRGSQVVEWWIYADEPEARRAVGLEA